jgi:cytochrome P450
MAECPFTPPWPQPLLRKPGLWRRFFLGWHSWVHTLFAGAYTMKLGQTRLPRFSVFMVNEPALVRRVLGAGGDDFPKHGLLSDMLGALVGSSVFSANGAAWRRQRAMVNPAFAHTNLARAFPVMLAASQDLVVRMRGLAGQGAVVAIDPLMTHVTADIIFRTLFSVPLGQQDALAIHRAFERYQRHAQRSAVLGLYRLPRLGFAWRAARAARAIRAVFEPLVAARLAASSGQAAGQAAGQADILDALIAARDAETGEGFSARELVDQIAVLFLAGHETSASALGWALYLLAACPPWQARVRAEVMECVEGGGLDPVRLKGCEALRNVFRETLRLYPPVSFLPRASARAVTLRDKAVSPRDLLIVAPWLIHRNPELWSCPHAFDPDRFTREEEAVRGAFLPFGQGARLCVGAGFAMQEAMVVLAQVLRHVRLEPAGEPEVVSRLTLRARGGIHLRLTPLAAGSDPAD